MGKYLNLSEQGEGIRAILENQFEIDRSAILTKLPSCLPTAVE
jgi:hypothetical protein